MGALMSEKAVIAVPALVLRPIHAQSLGLAARDELAPLATREDTHAPCRHWEGCPRQFYDLAGRVIIAALAVIAAFARFVDLARRGLAACLVSPAAPVAAAWAISPLLCLRPLRHLCRAYPPRRSAEAMPDTHDAEDANKATARLPRRPQRGRPATPGRRQGRAWRGQQVQEKRQ